MFIDASERNDPMPIHGRKNKGFAPIEPENPGWVRLSINISPLRGFWTNS